MIDRDTVCPVGHTHGLTPTCYRSHKCGCANCRKANRVRCYEYKKQRAYGRPTGTLVPAAPTQAWLADLLAAGMTPATIAKAAGVDLSTVRHIRAGGITARRRPAAEFRIYQSTASKILSVDADLALLPATVRVVARGARRRLQALGARGWSLGELARRLDLGRCRLERACQQQWIAQSLHQAIAGLYDQLWDQEPPTDTRSGRVARTMALTRARAAGWVPPLAWDDIDTDPAPPTVDSAPVVDDVAIALALRGEPVRLTAVERGLVVEEGTRRGLSLRELADRVQITDRHVERLRAGRREAA